jgi:probable HAF family extracellular repeat protein
VILRRGTTWLLLAVAWGCLPCGSPESDGLLPDSGLDERVTDAGNMLDGGPSETSWDGGIPWWARDGGTFSLSSVGSVGPSGGGAQVLTINSSNVFSGIAPSPDSIGNVAFISVDGGVEQIWPETISPQPKALTDDGFLLANLFGNGLQVVLRAPDGGSQVTPFILVGSAAAGPLVCGKIRDSQGDRVVVWRPDAAEQRIVAPFETVGPPVARACNKSGAVVGYVTVVTDGIPAVKSYQPFIWRSGRMETILEAGSNNVAVDVSDSEFVVAIVSSGDGRIHSKVWKEGVSVRVEAPSQYRQVVANGVNNDGVVVGNVYSEDGGQSAFVWQGGVFSLLDDLLPADSGWQLTAANDVNDSLVVVGAGRRDGKDQGVALRLGRLDAER